MSIFGDAWRKLKSTPLIEVIVAVQAAIKWIKGGKKK